MNPQALLMMAEKHYAYSRVIEARVFDTLPKRVGYIMHSHDLGPAELEALVRSCDVDADRLDKGEFRQLLRGLGGGSSYSSGSSGSSVSSGSEDYRLLCRAWLAGERTSLVGKGCSNREIDTYFSSIDTDKSGSLDVNEVSRQLLQLKEAIRRKAYASGLAKCTGLRQTMEAFQRAAALVVTWQSRPAARRPSASTCLGKLLLEKSIKVDALRTGLDLDGSGKIDKVEFGEALRSHGLGFECTAEEVDELFDEFDVDCSQSLVVKELMVSITKLLQDARDQAAAEARAAGDASGARVQAEQAMRRAFKLAAAQAWLEV